MEHTHYEERQRLQEEKDSSVVGLNAALDRAILLEVRSANAYLCSTCTNMHATQESRETLEFELIAQRAAIASSETCHAAQLESLATEKSCREAELQELRRHVAELQVQRKY